jgi:hypothetical protein
MNTEGPAALIESQVGLDLYVRPNGFLPSDRRSYNALFATDHFLGRERVDCLFPKWRSGLQARMLERIRKNGPARVIPVPRFKNLDRKAFMRKFVGKTRPVVFEGAAENWECCRKWSFAWIKEKYGSDDVFLVDHAEWDRNPLGKDSDHITLGDLIDGIDHGSTKYARFHPLLQRHPELRDDIDQTWVSEYITNPHTSVLRWYILFLGGKGTDTAIHNAFSENLFIQIRGLKRWRLYPPDHTPIFDPVANRSVYKSTYFQADQPDFDRYPMARHMDYYETVLEQGDVLYIPPYYWHHVLNPVSSIGVGFRWNNLRTALRASPLLTTMETFNTNPNVIRAMMMTLTDFNLVLAQNKAERKRKLAQQA